VVLNKDNTVWLEGARPAKTCISPSFMGMRLLSRMTHSFASLKNSKIQQNNFFILKIRERVRQTHFWQQ